MINIGDKYNDWEVIGKADRDRYYICRCTCGTIREVQDYSLTSGNSKSCGKNHDLMIKAGDRFNYWEVIGPAEKKNYYTCRCDCGKIKDVLKYQLTSGKSKGCGHQNHVRTHHLEEQTFGVWKVLDYIGDQKYRCECTVCGKQRDILWYRLTDGYTKGCNHSIVQEENNLKGRVFGRLKVIEYAGRKKWLCECECGNRKILLGANLINESTKSCGCLDNERTMQKDYILSKIEEYKAEHNSNPSILDMCNLLELGKNQVRRYIERYGLENYLDKTFGSCQEKEIHDFIKTFYSGKIELHNREILSGQEIDIYLPEIKLGIEFNGDYWHSELFKEQTYHQNKVIDALNKGINVYSIFECEYKLSKDYVLGELKKLIENSDETKREESLAEEIEVNLGKEDCISYLNNGYDMVEVIAPTSVWIYKHEPIRNIANFIETMGLKDKIEDEKIEALYNLGAFRIFNCGKAKLKLKQ